MSRPTIIDAADRTGSMAEKKPKRWMSKGHLTTEARKSMPRSDFALPGHGEGPKGKGAGSYPIPDASHARNALARVSQHGTAAEKQKVRVAVHRKFPGIGERSKRKPMYTDESRRKMEH